MPTVRELEQQIEKLEHFPVRITNTQTGRGVKSNAWIKDLDDLYVNAASGSDSVLQPLFRWNHAGAIARAQAGLEPYARAQALH
jgi:hypothetical protein